MSFRAMDLAMRARALCPTALAHLVLLNLAWHHNHRTGQCFPSYERIAEEIGISRSTVADAIKGLCDAGVIQKVQGRRRGSHSGSNRYRLLFTIQARLDALGRVVRAGVRDFGDRPPAGRDKGKPSSSVPSEEGVTRAKKKRSQRKAIVTRMQEDWTPNAKQRAKAVQLGLPDEMIDHVVFKFTQWWISTGEVRANWGASWYLWVTNEVERLKGHEERSRNSGTGADDWREQRRASLEAFRDAPVVDFDRWIAEGPPGGGVDRGEADDAGGSS